jgi:hypothetical protein
MAGCDSGYFCIECEVYVQSVLDSELYLRYIMGEIPSDALVALPDRHIRCNPEIAQYIVNEKFPPLVEEREGLDKRTLDAAEVASREDLVTRAWVRLQEIPTAGVDVPDYPLPGVEPPDAETFLSGWDEVSEPPEASRDGGGAIFR